ncbi:MAG: hypothetical protein AAB909_05095 [Patescibacteria group bacterium]
MPDSFQKQIQIKITKSSPAAIASVINFSTRSFVAVFRFIGQLFRDALGK